MKNSYRVLLVGSFCVSQAFAAGYNFIKETPFARFSKDDMQIFTTTLYKALDEFPDGRVTTWSGDVTTGSKGSIEVLQDPQSRQGCRVAHIANAYKTLKGEGEYLFCKKNGKWTASPL